MRLHVWYQESICHRLNNFFGGKVRLCYLALGRNTSKLMNWIYFVLGITQIFTIA